MIKNKSHIALLALLTLQAGSLQAQTATQNYVKTETMLDTEGRESLKAVQYYNGLGYPTLSVATVGLNGETACTLTTYDALGRENLMYVPVPGSGLDYLSESNIKGRGYYLNDNSGFTQNHYDALDRVTAVDMAGDKWREAGAQNRTEYLTNAADEVLHYEAPEDGFYSLVNPENSSFEYYPECSLHKTITTDADGKSVAVFTDLQGKKILERTASGDTYYVYNDLGQLRFVLPPAFDRNNSLSKRRYAYEYRYDERGRISKKILPNASTGVTITYCYDKADRIAFVKDPAIASSTSGGTTYKYRFYLYDRLGRLCVQGICSNAADKTSTLSTTTYVPGSSGINKTGYTAPYTIYNVKLEIVNYYDNYNFIDNKLTGSMPVVTVSDNQKQYAIGSMTGQVVYTSNGKNVGTINIYDQQGQVVRSVHKGLYGYTEDVSTTYNEMTGAVESTEAKVNVRYGSDFVAKTDYTYSYGKKKKMKQSVRHGMTALSRETEYGYDFAGRLSGKNRQLTGTNKSYCTYSYDVHGWPTSISSGGFQEKLYYADGFDGGCYNGNISTMEWKGKDETYFRGYNLKYDGNNRLYDAAYGEYEQLADYKNLYDEHVEYDANGNITKLQRRGLVDNQHGGFGLVDDLTMSYNGNRLSSVRDDAKQLNYAGATDFSGKQGQSYTLTHYTETGALKSDKGRNIAKIDYDRFSNPIRIQFTNGNVTKYVYSATGEKLQVIYQTAVPNISVAIGSTKELTASQIQYTDSVDYLLGGMLTVRNGRIDQYQFEEGYCQAEQYASDASKDKFTFCYYDQDHLGNIRQVTQDNGTSKGKVIQKVNYYPFGLQLCDGTTDSNVQSHRYNGKELDKMHGLNTYDYGARQYNPVTARWDRIDPLCEKYYSISPYAYCAGNPVKYVDPDGRDIWQINGNGEIISRESDRTKERFEFYMINPDGSKDPLYNYFSLEEVKPVELEYGTVKWNEMGLTKTKDQFGNDVEANCDILEIKGEENARLLFESLSNCNIEFSLFTFDSESQYITTSHTVNTDMLSSSFLNNLEKEKRNQLNSVEHNHPNGDPTPSGIKDDQRNGRKAGTFGDIGFKKWVTNDLKIKNANKPDFFRIFTPNDGVYTTY